MHTAETVKNIFVHILPGVTFNLPFFSLSLSHLSYSDLCHMRECISVGSSSLPSRLHRVRVCQLSRVGIFCCTYVYSGRDGLKLARLDPDYVIGA